MWTQNFDPLGSIWLSALVAFLPILCFFLCLAVFKLKGYVAGLITVFVASLVAIFAYGMPFSLLGSTFIVGFLTGMWPIAWFIIAAIFLYNLSIKSGQFEVIRQSIMGITPDHRIQVVLIGFCFGSFLEGAIGFGGPVAITAALLVGLGLRPLYAAGLCMIANTAPVAFGAVGIPIIAMANLVGVEQYAISAMVGRILPPLTLFVPFFLVFVMDGMKGIRETFPAVAVAAVSFAATQYWSSNHLGAELPDIVSAIVSIGATTLFLKYWKPKAIFRFDDKKDFEEKNNFTFSQIIYAWSPFIFLIVFIAIWTQAPFKALFAKDGLLAYTNLSVIFGDITGGILKPSLSAATAEPSKVALVSKVALINNSGTAILFAAILSIFVLKVKASDAADCFGATLKTMALPVFTIGLVLSFAYIANNSGMSATLGIALSKTGSAFTFFSPFIGWIGVFLTGSDTSSNLLFGTLQQVTAHQLGVKEALFLAANTVGGVVGKMISPQSIAIACAAVGLVGKESDLFRFTVKYSVMFIIFIGIWISIIAYAFPFIIPDTIPLVK